MESFPENIAHFTHGMAFMFFVAIAVHLYWQQTKNRLIWFLFWEAIFFAFIEIKDIAYLIEGVWHNSYLTRIFLSFDMWIVPFTMLFLFELMSPGWVTPVRAITMSVPSIILSVVLIFVSSKEFFYWVSVYSILLGITTLLIVFLASARYDNYIKKNFSYTEGLSVSWVRTIIVILFIYLNLWFFILQTESWWGDAIYYLITIAVWSFIYFYTVQHVIIEVPDSLFRLREKKNTVVPDCPYPFSDHLRNVMEKEKLFLNPKLQITDVAAKIHTNRTYLSDYLNKYMTTTFYDYVNSFRIDMACGLLVNERKQTLEQIAEECGFNSLSTFSRSFSKIKQCSPSEYRKYHLSNPSSPENT